MLSGHGEDDGCLQWCQPAAAHQGVHSDHDMHSDTVRSQASLIHAESGKQLPITPSSGPGRFGSIALVALQEQACCRTTAEHSMAAQGHHIWQLLTNFRQQGLVT